MFACNGILFNHESPRRGETFVTRKVRFCLKKLFENPSKYSFNMTLIHILDNALGGQDKFGTAGMLSARQP